MLLAKLIQELQRHGKIHFEAVFLVMNPGYNADNWNIIQDNAKLLGIPLTVFNSEIFDTVAGIEEESLLSLRPYAPRIPIFSCERAGLQQDRSRSSLRRCN